jgi:tetratricopeptide (TPR) repeat protein
MRSWARPEARRRLAAVLPDPEQLAHRSALCDAVANGTVDTWDYQWAYARLIRGGLAAVPSRNLVSNIGFGAGATHTMQRWAAGSDLPRYLMPFPLRAPAAVEADRDYDRAWFEWQAGRPSVDTVVAQAEGLLAARRHVEALLLLASRMGETQLRPHRASLLLRQARALAALQRPDRAVTALDEILAIEPGNAAALELRGRLASTS